MNPPNTARSPASTTSVTELVDQRTRIQAWLEKLDAESGGASPRVVERLRADYQARLEAVLEQLGAHVETIRSDQTRLREELETAERTLDASREELEEARLRHRIGEWDDDLWAERKPGLEDALSAAEQRRDEALHELSRLEELIAQIEGSSSTAGGGEEENEDDLVVLREDVTSTPEVAAGSDDASEAGREAPRGRKGEEQADGAGSAGEADPLAFLADLPGDAGAEAAPTEESEPKGEGLDFLQELDRAITGLNGPPEEEDPELFRPTPGTKCPECGYTNDPDAWYCGVCGVDLA